MSEYFENGEEEIHSTPFSDSDPTVNNISLKTGELFNANTSYLLQSNTEETMKVKRPKKITSPHRHNLSSSGSSINSVKN